ncbi:Formin-like protein 3 [Diplonema papillatum]|nr:Formin-like protein 3 [Diplonema papillatum]
MELSLPGKGGPAVRLPADWSYMSMHSKCRKRDKATMHKWTPAGERSASKKPAESVPEKSAPTPFGLSAGSSSASTIGGAFSAASSSPSSYTVFSPFSPTQNQTPSPLTPNSHKEELDLQRLLRLSKEQDLVRVKELPEREQHFMSLAKDKFCKRRGSRAATRPTHLDNNPGKDDVKRTEVMSTAIQAFKWGIASAEGTAFADAVYLLPEGLGEELQSAFKKPERQKQAPGGAAGKPAKKKLIDQQRQLTVGVFLQYVKKSSDAIKQIVMDLDPSFLEEDVAKMMQLCPTDEEMTAVKDLTPEELFEAGKVVQFFHMIAHTPGFERRLRCWNAQMGFMALHAGITGKLDNISDFCTKAKKSVKLRNTLAIILGLGNEANGLDRDSAPKAVRVEDLLKITTQKTAAGTFLDLSVEYLYKIDPGMLDFADEISGIKFVKDCDLSVLEADYRQLKAGYQLMNSAVNDKCSDARLKGAMEMHNQKELVDDMDVRYLAVKEELVDTMKYFGEGATAKVSTAQEWAKQFATFVSQFEKCRQKVAKQNATKCSKPLSAER